jgi:phthalate 4,5-cis-dihydrodiol dehydrogenase
MGNAGLGFVPSIERHADFVLAAFAEPVEQTRLAAQERYGAPGYATVEAMIAAGGLDAVCIASPTELHSAQALQAIAAGLHVLTEKPMAITLDDARRMVRAAEERGVVLLVGHSHSYDLPILRMREIIQSGRLGKVCMAHNWCFTDWIYRPRRADELVAASGGGVTIRQGSHQFDMLRLLCGEVRSLRARTFDMDKNRSAIGAHCVYLDFENGAAGTAVYNGYGGFQSVDLVGGVSEWGFPAPEEGWRAQRRQIMSADPQAALKAKAARAGKAIPDSAPLQPHFGFTLVNCELGDLRQSPQGLYLYDKDGMQEIVLPADRTPRDLVMDELSGAVRGHAPALHDGRWGLANLEVCLAAIASSEQSAEIRLSEQKR